jgi:pseudaminic acid cytidylyltransferase
MHIAVIPARGGSKRIPGKNIKDFCGKPIIAYSILAARKSNLFDHIFVSTDSEEIAEVAIEWGAEVPFKRPKRLSDDFTGITDVVAHAISEYEKKSKIDYACCIYATAPFLTAENLNKGYELIRKGEKLFVFSATSFPFPIFRSFSIDENQSVEMFWPEHYETRSQDLPEAYHDAGQFAWGKPEGFLGKKNAFSRHSSALVIPRKLVQDIDTVEDWERAELMHTALQLQNKIL